MASASFSFRDLCDCVDPPCPDCCGVVSSCCPNVPRTLYATINAPGEDCDGEVIPLTYNSMTTAWEGTITTCVVGARDVVLSCAGDGGGANDWNFEVVELVPGCLCAIGGLSIAEGNYSCDSPFQLVFDGGLVTITE